MSCSAKFLACAASILMGVSASSAVAASIATSVPSSGPAAEAQALKVVVVEVHGLVQARTADDQPWQAAKEGMVLGQGASFRTGPRAWVTCQIPPDQTFRLDRLGTVKVDEAIRTGNKVKTDLIMEYGRTQYDIEAAGVEHESTIRSPSSTLAVRGTNVRVFDQPPFAPEAESYTGTALYQTAQRQTKLGGWQYAQVNSDSGTAAQTALDNSVVDPSSSNARSESEHSYISQQVSRGAFFSFDQKSGISTVENGPGPQTDSELANSLPGTLNIVLRWTGNANLDMLTDNEAGNPLDVLANFQPTELLYPGYGLNVSSSGGIIPYNDKGGPNGGQEIAYWQNSNYPQGVYGLSAISISGAKANLDFNAFLNGKPLNLLAFEVDKNGNEVLSDQGYPILIKNTKIARPLDPGDTVSVIFFVPPYPAIEDGVPQEPPLTDAQIMALLEKIPAQSSSTRSGRPVMASTAFPARTTTTLSAKTFVQTASPRIAMGPAKTR